MPTVFHYFLLVFDVCNVQCLNLCSIAFLVVGQQIELSAIERVAGADVQAFLSSQERWATVVVLVVEAVAGNGLEFLTVRGTEQVKAPFVVLHKVVDIEIFLGALHVNLVSKCQ